jgi:hypothetical protein
MHPTAPSAHRAILIGSIGMGDRDRLERLIGIAGMLRTRGMRRRRLHFGLLIEAVDTLENYFSGAVESATVVKVARSIIWGAEVRYRENIPLTVMGVISLAILCLFGVAEMATRDTQRQHDSCGGSRQAAISSELDRTLPPCFPSLPPSHLPVPTG